MESAISGPTCPVACSKIDHLFQPLEDTIKKSFIAALTGKDSPNDQLRNLLVLPSRLSGLWLQNPYSLSVLQYTASINITSPLVHTLLGESNNSAGEIQCDQLELIREHKKKKSTELRMLPNLSVQNCQPTFKNKWAVPVKKELPAGLLSFPYKTRTSISTSLISGMLLCLRYGWESPHLPSTCTVCLRETIHSGSLSQLPAQRIPYPST